MEGYLRSCQDSWGIGSHFEDQGSAEVMPNTVRSPICTDSLPAFDLSDRGHGELVEEAMVCAER